jgi:hypothetical protein
MTTMIAAALEQDLLDLERKFWTGNAEFYHRHLDDKCLTVFTGMVGVFNKEDIAAQAKSGHQWKNLALDVKGFVQPAEDVAILSYEVSAERKDGRPHKALASTGYVRRYGDWKMAFHQQTQLAA